jgi:Family of unknown function (DUF6510)
MDALDGNAIGGLLMDVFGHDMTTAMTLCAECGSMRPAAELSVYLRAPGVVVRCPSCESIAMVLVTIRGVNVVDLRGLTRFG